VREWVVQAKEIGFKLTILSNTHSPRRLSKIASELDIPSVSHALKPRTGEFKKAARLAGCETCRVVVVGDQVLTDILGGNLAGMRTILVKPMHPYEFIGTKFSRLVERLILSLLSQPTWLGTKSEGMQSQTKDTK
jgi:HAD superfamily phosphatase (TIGR01668 family)